MFKTNGIAGQGIRLAFLPLIDESAVESFSQRCLRRLLDLTRSVFCGQGVVDSQTSNPRLRFSWILSPTETSYAAQWAVNWRLEGKRKAAATHGRGGVGNLSAHHLPTSVFERVMTYEKGVIQAYKDTQGGENKLKTGRGGVGNMRWTSGLRIRSSKTSLDSTIGTLSSFSHSVPSEPHSSNGFHSSSARLIEHPDEDEEKLPGIPFPSVDRIISATVNVRTVPVSTQVVVSRKRLPSNPSFHPVPLMEMAAASRVSLITNASKTSWMLARSKARSLFSRNSKAAASTPEIELQDFHHLVEAPSKLRKKREGAAVPVPVHSPAPVPERMPTPPLPQRPTHVKGKSVLSSSARRREVFVFESVPPTPPVPKPHGIILTVTPNTPTTPGDHDSKPSSPADDRPLSPSVTRPPPPPRSARLDSLLGQSRSPFPRGRDSAPPLPSPLPSASTFPPSSSSPPAVPPLPESAHQDRLVRKGSTRRQKSTTKRPPASHDQLARYPSLPKNTLRPPLPGQARRRAYTTSRVETEADAASLDPSFFPAPLPQARTRRPSSASYLSDAGSDASTSSTAAVARLHRDLLVA